MAGMSYTFSADVAPFVGAMGEAIAAAKRFESAVHDARDAELELGASGGEAAAGMAAQAAAMDAAAHSADKLNRQHGLLHTAMTDAERAARDAGRGIGDLEKAAMDAAGSGGGLSKMGGMLSGLAMPAAIAGLQGSYRGAQFSGIVDHLRERLYVASHRDHLRLITGFQIREHL